MEYAVWTTESPTYLLFIKSGIFDPIWQHRCDNDILRIRYAYEELKKP